MSEIYHIRSIRKRLQRQRNLCADLEYARRLRELFESPCSSVSAATPIDSGTKN
jgi:hypothetical protein